MSRSSRFLAVGLLALVAGCMESTGGGDPEVVALALFAGDDQTADAGTAVAIDPAVKVTVDGVAESGVTVEFAVTQGGGNLTGASAVSGADGVARVSSWVMGTAGPQAITATLAGATGSPLTITATSTAPVPTAIEAVDNPTTGTVGAATTPAPKVRIESASGAPVGGVAVTWAVTGGGGGITGADVVTASDGTASVDAFTLGTLVAGNPNTLTATAACCGTVTFTVASEAGPVTQVIKIEGDGQAGPVGTMVPILPKVRLQDVFGNPAPNRAITFVVIAGGGTITGAQPLSGIDGMGAVGSWTAGAVPGPNSLNATSNGVTVTFTVTALAEFDPTPFAGTYTGTWINTTFGSVGTGQAIITVNAVNKTVTVTASATGNVLGGGPVNAPVQNGDYSHSGAEFTGNVAPMGNIVADIDGQYAIVASGTNVPAAGIAGWLANGSITANALILNFTVNFTAGAPAFGTINLTKP